jgi:hypothetical protein
MGGCITSTKKRIENDKINNIDYAIEHKNSEDKAKNFKEGKG